MKLPKISEYVGGFLRREGTIPRRTIELMEESGFEAHEIEPAYRRFGEIRDAFRRYRRGKGPAYAMSWRQIEDDETIQSLRSKGIVIFLYNPKYGERDNKDSDSIWFVVPWIDSDIAKVLEGYKIPFIGYANAV